MESLTDENSIKKIPTAKIYDISKAVGISWQYDDCGWHLKDLPQGSMLIIPNH